MAKKAPQSIGLRRVCVIMYDGAGLFQDSVCAEHFLDFFQSCCHLVACVCGHQAEADKGILGCHGGRYNGVDEDALFKKVACDGECLEVVADEERDDGGGGVPYLASHVAESFEGVVGEFPELLLAFGL